MDGGAEARRWMPDVWHRRAGLAALAIGGAGAAVTAVSAYVAYRSARPNRTFGDESPPEGSYQHVHFLSSDGLRLSGWYLPTPEPGTGIVLCHGFRTGRREVLPLAMELQARGHPVLIFDFRAHGESEGRWTSLGLLEPHDLEGAVRFLLGRHQVKGDRVGVVGFSMGAAVSILTAARMPEIGAVVADSSFAGLREVVSNGYRIIWGMPSFPFALISLWFAERLMGIKAKAVRPLDAIGGIAPRPVLIIHGGADRLIPIADAQLLYASAGEPRELWTIPDADHVQARLLDLRGYAERVDEFFTKWLRPPEESGLPSTTDRGSSRS